MFVFCCYSTSVFWLFGQLVHNLKTHLKFKHAVCTSYHNICDLFIIKNKWTKTKKSPWLSLQEMVLYKRCVYTAKKHKTKQNQKVQLVKTFFNKQSWKALQKKQQKNKSALLNLFSGWTKMFRYQTSEMGSRGFPLWSSFHDQTGLRVCNPTSREAVKWGWTAASWGEGNIRVCLPF